MRRPIELRRGRAAWHVHVAPDARVPAAFWGAYRRETFAEGLALVNEVIAAGQAFYAARRAVQRAQGTAVEYLRSMREPAKEC